MGLILSLWKAPQIELWPLERGLLAGYSPDNLNRDTAEERNVKESHFSFIPIQLTESKPLIQLNPMSCLLQSIRHWKLLLRSVNRDVNKHQQPKQTNKKTPNETSWSRFGPPASLIYRIPSKRATNRWLTTYMLAAKPEDRWPATYGCEPINGRCCRDDCFLSSFRKRHL